MLPATTLIAAAPVELSREIFGNVPSWAQTLFYMLALAVVGAWCFGVGKRIWQWRKGRSGEARMNWPLIARRLAGDVLLLRRVRGRGLASIAHMLLFGGFVVLFIGTTLVAIEHVLADLLGREPSDPVFHKGVYFGVYELVMDVFGIALLVGCVMFLVRRLRGTESFARSPADIGVLLALILIGVTGYLVEGLRIMHAATPLPGLSPVGYVCAQSLAAMGIERGMSGPLHFALWWLHAIGALGFIALMPYTRLLHSIAGAVNLAVRDHRPGVMSPVSLEEVEATGQIGVSRLADFSRRQLLELDACVSCGRCEDSCPAFEAGKPLSPRNVVQDLVGVLNTKGVAESVHGRPIAAETLWSCTTCGACADVCPLGISPLRMITDMRRFLIGEGALRGAPAAALQKTDRAGNPWGMSPGERMAWAAGLNVPLASEFKKPPLPMGEGWGEGALAQSPTPSLGPLQERAGQDIRQADFEILYWVGCAAAYDRRVQKVARSVVRLLQAAGVRFAVLGPEERCTGESARRMGDELLFQQLATQNIETLASHSVRRIVAHCPHCVNSLRNDYSQLGGRYEVVHHSQLLAELIEQGRLKENDEARMTNDELQSSDRTSFDIRHSSLTYHDPCYLARVAGVTNPPRAVLAASGNGDAGGRSPLTELPCNRRQTACCGAGGGRMWFDDPPAERVGQGRVEEILATGAKTVAVSCPFCLIMVGDGIAAHDTNVRVRDIAEVLAEALLGPETSS